MRWTLSVLVLWGLICLSQSLFAWQLEHGHIVRGITRARGLVSHPLTLAYTAAVLWPWCQQILLMHPKKLSSWLAFLSIATIVWTSESRTVQLCCFVFLVFGVFRYLRGRNRLIASGLIALFSVLALSIEGPVSRKIWATIEGKDQQESTYKDDRIAFWHANFHLFKKSPLIGHGEAFPSELLEQAYQEIGLGDLSKKYEAHNMYLSVLVHEGIIGLLFFLSWLSVLGVSMRKSGREYPLIGSAAWQSALILCLAALTQNALQDSEVRFVFAASIAAWMGRKSSPLPTTDDQRI